MTVQHEFLEDVVLERMLAGNVWTNLPKRRFLYDNLYDFGNASAETANLSFNILCHFLSSGVARALHHEFIRDFLNDLPYKGGTIKNQDIRNWLDRFTPIGEAEPPKDILEALGKPKEDVEAV
ncbi:MAG: hypothetical protein LBQ86_06245 [Holophagales bacterium]|jgi:hypothetical protein|nr:hypothetical protein [Holophagales bacterium]